MCGKYRKEIHPTKPVAIVQNVTDLMLVAPTISKNIKRPCKIKFMASFLHRGHVNKHYKNLF